MAKQRKQKEEIKEQSGTGIVLIARGHPMYGHYAYNAAVCCKFISPELPVTVVTSNGCLSQLDTDQVQLFDTIIEAGSKWAEDGNYFQTKLWLDEITPYEKTLYLDVDMAWNPRKKITDFLELLSGMEFQCVSRGEIDVEKYQSTVGDWMDYSTLKELYGLSHIYNVSSELIYFEKGTKVFEYARKAYEENKIQPKQFAGTKPDEPYLALGIALSETILPLSEFEPTYWQNRFFNKFKKDELIYEEYYAISAGGNSNAVNTERMYNNIVGATFNGMGINRTPYKLQHKRNVLKKERQLL